MLLLIIPDCPTAVGESGIVILYSPPPPPSSFEDISLDKVIEQCRYKTKVEPILTEEPFEREFPWIIAESVKSPRQIYPYDWLDPASFLFAKESTP